MNSVGSYDQCHDLVSTERVALKTKYCLAQIDLSSRANQLSTLTGQPKSLFAPVGGRPAKIGLCLPNNCTSDDVIALTDHIISSSLHDAQLFIQTIQCDDRKTVKSPGDDITLILSLIIVFFFIVATTTATILDLSNKKECKLTGRVKLKFNWFIEIFSMYRGYKKLMTKRSLNSKQVDVRVIDGLRVISMLWIIVIHSYNFGFQWLLFDNLNKVDNVYKEALIQWVANGTFSVDNFFLISGFLAWFKCLNNIGLLKDRSKSSKKLDCKKGKISASSSSENSLELNNEDGPSIEKWFLIKNFLSNIWVRYLRLVPTMMFLILISVSMLPRFNWAPNWSNATIMFDDWCRFNWYINFVLLQNFINTSNMCFSHSWYLAADFQLFILVNLIISLIYYFSRSDINLSNVISSAKWLLVSATIFAQLLIVTIIYYYELPSAPLVPVDSLVPMLNYYSLVYIKPYYWLTSYFIGSLLAICIINLTSKELIVQTGMKENSGASSNIIRSRLMRVKRIISIMKVVSPCILVGLILSILPYFKGPYKMVGALSILHALFARPLWSLSLASILFIILQIRSKFVSKNNLVYKMIHFFLSSKLWLPLSRLTYSAYLFHPLVMAIFYGSRKETFKFSHSLILYFCLGNIILTYFGSLIIYLMIELPIQIALVKITLLLLYWFKKKKHPSLTGTQAHSSDFFGLSMRRPRRS